MRSNTCRCHNRHPHNSPQPHPFFVSQDQEGVKKAKSRGHTGQRGPRERGKRQRKKLSHTQGRKRGREKCTAGRRADQQGVEERVTNAATRKEEGGYDASKASDAPGRGAHAGKEEQPQATAPRHAQQQEGERERGAPERQTKGGSTTHHDTHRTTTHPPAHRHHTDTAHTTHTHAQPPAPRTGGTSTRAHPHPQKVSDGP